MFTDRDSFEDIKNALDEHVLSHLRYPNGLERNIRLKIQKSSPAPKRRINFLLPCGIAACILFMVFIQLLHFDSNSVNSSNALGISNVSEISIEDKVEELKKSLKLGLTQSAVKNMLGEHYISVNDNGDIENGSDEFWKYSFFKSEDYTPPNSHEIDEQGLKQGKVGVDLFIGWKDEKIHFYSISYPKNDKSYIYFYIVNPDGSSYEQLLE